MDPKLERARLWLELAQEKLEVARELLDLGRFDDAVSKAYYVMFYATRAALATRGIELRRHSGAIALLGQEFVRDNKLDIHYVRLLTRAMQAREVSDYDPSVRATRQDAEEAVTKWTWCGAGKSASWTTATSSKPKPGLDWYTAEA